MRSSSRQPMGGEPLRVLRMIGRLNVGGPAIQAITLTRRLEARGYETTLVRGIEGPDEGNMDWLADREGVHPFTLPSLRRQLGAHDFAALLQTLLLLRRLRPAILHTHAAKAGTIGRLAAMLLGGFGPSVRVHTFHGHVLTGYFGRGSTRLFLAIERFLGRRTTLLIAVSEEVREDLLAMEIAPGDRIAVVPLGFDLEPFKPVWATPAHVRDGARLELGLDPNRLVVTLVARLVPIKRVDRFLSIARRVADLAPGAQFLIVGDGELRGKLQSSADARALAGVLTWAGMHRNMPMIYSASDVVVLTSDNEGTPVSLIEAQACGMPTVSTDVGGVRTVVLDHQTGYVLPATDEVGFARSVASLLHDSDRRRSLGAGGREHVFKNFGLDRLVDDIDGLYRELLRVRAGVPAPRVSWVGS